MLYISFCSSPRFRSLALYSRLCPRNTIPSSLFATELCPLIPLNPELWHHHQAPSYDITTAHLWIRIGNTGVVAISEAWVLLQFGGGKEGKEAIPLKLKYESILYSKKPMPQRLTWLFKNSKCLHCHSNGAAQMHCIKCRVSRQVTVELESLELRICAKVPFGPLHHH